MNLCFAHTHKQWSRVPFPVQFMLCLPAETESKNWTMGDLYPGPSSRSYPMLPLSQTAEEKKKEFSNVKHTEISLYNIETIDKVKNLLNLVV